jgi:hypothetical protein
MAAGNYLATRSEQEEFQHAEAVERRHIAAVPEGEREEVREILRGLGIVGLLLNQVVKVITAPGSLGAPNDSGGIWATGCGAFTVPGGLLNVWSIFSLRSRPTYSIHSGREKRLLGGFGGNRPDIRHDRRAQEPVVGPAMVVFRPRNSCYWRRCCRRSLRNRGLASRPHPLILRQSHLSISG